MRYSRKWLGSFHLGSLPLTRTLQRVHLRCVDWLSSTAAIYGRVLRRGGELALRNWPVGGVLFVYGLLGMLVGVAALALTGGLIAGLVFLVVRALCVGSFLAMVEAIVRTNRATLDDFRASFGSYFFDVIGFMFALALASLATMLVEGHPLESVIRVFSGVLIFVFFNAVPELIYLGHHSTIDLLRESYEFISANWIEWFPLNLALACGGGILLALPSLNTQWFVPAAVVSALYVFFAMIVRGLLFLELADTSRRSRIFRHRAGS